VARLVAIALYGAYWGLWLFGYLDINRGDLPQVPRELFLAIAFGLPCFLVGAAIGRWWAPAVGLFFVAFVIVGDRCVDERIAGDVSGTACFGLAASDLPLVLAITTPCVIAGTVLSKLFRAWLGRLPARA
jgi:hypothetical protein